METKVCSKCKRELDISCFHKRKRSRDGLCVWCKSCYKQWRKYYYKNHVEETRQYGEQYRKNNIEKEIERHKKYYKNNVELRRVYNKNNKNKIKKYNSEHCQESALFDLYYVRLKQFEEIRCCPKNLKLLEVKCVYCGKWFRPTNIQVINRIQYFNKNTKHGEARFYCSENCKRACPIYQQNKYPKGFKQATSREVVPLLRQLVLERDNYTCQKCGTTTETAQLHVHNIVPYAKNKMQANDPDSCITLCKSCHKEVHSQDGCRYIDLTC